MTRGGRPSNLNPTGQTARVNMTTVCHLMPRLKCAQNLSLNWLLGCAGTQISSADEKYSPKQQSVASDWWLQQGGTLDDLTATTRCNFHFAGRADSQASSILKVCVADHGRKRQHVSSGMWRRILWIFWERRSER
jgi:hypothetical protein